MNISPKSILDQFPQLPVNSPRQENVLEDVSFRLPGAEKFSDLKQSSGEQFLTREERDKLANQIRKDPESLNKLVQDSYESFVTRRVAPLIDFVRIRRENPDIQEDMTAAFMNVYARINNLKAGTLQGIIDAMAILDPIELNHELVLESRSLVILLGGGDIPREGRNKIASLIRKDPLLLNNLAQGSVELFEKTVTPLIDFVQIARENPDIRKSMTAAFFKEYNSQLNNPAALQAILDAATILDPVKQLRALELESQALQIRNNPVQARRLAVQSIENIITADNPGVLTDFATIGRNHPDLAQNMVGVFVEEAAKLGLTPGQIDSLVIASGHSDPLLQASELQRVAREIHATRFPGEDHNTHGHFIDDGFIPIIN